MVVVAATVTALFGYLSPASGPGLAGRGLSGPITAATLLSKIADAAGRAKVPDVRDSQFEYIASMVAFSSGTVTFTHSTTQTKSRSRRLP